LKFISARHSGQQWLGKSIRTTQKKDADYLFHYAQQFNTIELNRYYFAKIPTDENHFAMEVRFEKRLSLVRNSASYQSRTLKLIGAAEMTVIPLAK
jgi:hypothetical protein